MKFFGWGNNISISANIFYPQNDLEIIKILKNKKIKKILCRGNGRSYGDNNLNSNMILLTKYKKKLKIDKKKKLLDCTSNYTFREISEILIKKGLFFNVTPGSSSVTIGGAISNDVHGKNHHIDGTFTNYLREMTLITPEGKILTCSKKKNKELFEATCGGAGLTGVITSVKIDLLKVKSKNIDVSISTTLNLRDTIKKFKELKNQKYLVAWMDTINTKNFGRSIIISGTHSNDNNFNTKRKIMFSLPRIFGKIFLNNFFIKIFNNFYFFINKNKKNVKQDYNDFFYPLDKITNWNKFYGSKGFTQIQILIPNKNNTLLVARKVFSFLNKNNIYSYLTTLKEFGKSNSNFLTFPEKGLTITLDIPISKNLINVYPILEKVLLKYKVKIYLAKDSYMSKNFFNKTYHRLNKFLKIKKLIDKNSKFSSIQSRRLGI